MGSRNQPRCLRNGRLGISSLKEGWLELSVVNPVGVFGPVLGPDYSTSILLVQRLMDGAMPGCPQLCFGAVDVRDVADLHIRAMTHPAAKGRAIPSRCRRFHDDA
jgi:nucleoside-diphosphate-sugar epimerase